MRGDVFRLKAPRNARGHEQAGHRYAIVLQNDALLNLSTWIVVPTSTAAPPASFRPVVRIEGTETRAILDHLTSVDPHLRLGPLVGHLTLAEMQAVDSALRKVTGLS